MPSNNVPLMFQRGSPAVDVASGDVRLDEGWHHQVAASVQIIGAQGRRFGLSGDVADQAVFQVQLMQAIFGCAGGR